MMDEVSGDGEGKAGGGGSGGVEEDMEVGDCSEEEEEEEEDMELGSSPIADQSNIMMGMQSPALPYEGLASPLRVGPVPLPGGKPVAMRRGPGRPRTRGGMSQPQVRTKRPVGLKLKRWKGLLVSGVYGSGNGKSLQEGEVEESTSPVQPSTPVEQVKTPIFVDEPLFSEQWPGKICILCNLSEHSQLGQGEMLRIECSIEDLPKDLPRDIMMSPPETMPLDSTSPRQPLQSRRQKGPAKSRNSGTNGQEPVDELSLVGHIDIPEPTNIVDSGYIYIHEWCASWTTGVTRHPDKRLENVAVGVMAAVSRRCYHCSRYGAGAPCVVPSCNKHFHTPCAAGAATFQYPKTLILICSQHIDHVTTMSELSDVTCQSCDSLGNPANLVMCSICGNHHHGACIGNALHPGLRAGWQCSDCRICQLCRVAEETNRMLLCEACDKAYHPYCVKPAMSSVPKVGWKCKRCRLCSDCGARTPGGGLSSRWHSNYTVCDSCYQQRNKGFSCPVCHKAYRAAALREMVRCSQCQRFVHGTCDKEADFVSYHRKKEAHPDYQYICLACKNNTTDKLLVLKRKDSTEEATLESNLSMSQESLLLGDDDLDSEKSDEAPLRLTIGLGKGKPFCASKMAKKRLGLGVGPGRPKGSGKMSAISPLSHYQKRSRFAEFGRKRGAKPKMRGIFGVPGLGLQRPQSDISSKTEDEPGGENKLVLCSSKDKFVLGQDMCVMCGSIGIDQEACLIACAQCGQCYHPYCVSVKVTKVMLQKGWRCLDCTVCEGCGQRNDEGRLILCDDCDISYHIYCMDPPLGSVPTGVWKCKWCAQCQTCGANSPGVNSNWQSNCTQCGPCASRTSCPACLELYTDGDLIIKCINCDRWLHCLCDTISNEQEAEACCSQGYTCVLCRPSNVALVVPAMPIRAPSPEIIDGKMSAADYYVDGVCLSEVGLQHIKILSLEHIQQPVRRKRPGFKRPQEADILATIESVVAGDAENGEGGKDSVYKDGMIWGSKESGPVPSPPEGFTLYTMESGVVILKRKKQRNLQKLGIGGFSAVKMRSSRFKDDEEGFMEDKPRRKPRCNKKKSKLAESYPSYLQEAFFGRDLLDTSKETNQDLESSSDDSDEGKTKVTQDKTITLSQVLEEVKAKREHMNGIKSEEEPAGSQRTSIKEEDDGSDGQALKDILRLPDNLLHTDLVNTIMNERDGEIKTENLIPDSALPETTQLNESGASQKDELSDILGPHFNIESMVRETGLPNMDSKDVEEIFKGVLTDESQESQTSGVFPMRGATPSTPAHQQLSPQPGSVQNMNVNRPQPTALPSVTHNISSPGGGFPVASPYNSEYSNSPQFSPEGSPWGGDDNGVSYNQRTSMKMESDEALGQSATISAVLFANLNHPEWRTEFPDWSERCKQILRKWRALPSETKAPYLQQARENRTNLRIRKAQQEQDKVQTAKSTREAEQERQWKQLQAMRQQQLLTQNRAQVPTKITRQVSGDGTVVQYTTEQGNPPPHLSQLQVSTSQEPNTVPGVSPRGPLFTSPVGALKVTPRVAAPNTAVFPRALRPPTPSPFSPPRQPIPEEMNRQLRDLLQRQHAKHGNSEPSPLLTPVVNSLRQPIPHPRPQTIQHHAIQGAEARVRLLLQQQRATFAGGQVRLAAPRPQQVDQFGLVQRTQFQHITAQSSAIIRNTQPIVGAEPVRLPQPTVEPRIPAGREGEEIPDSVTAELEKLEQEGGNIAEVEAVSAILGDLVEDDDELLAEMGADFNILEYADPELDNVAGGEKTNIFDDLEDEVEKKKQSSEGQPNTNKSKRDNVDIKGSKTSEKSVREKETKQLVTEQSTTSSVVTIVNTPTTIPSQLTPTAPVMPQNATQFTAPNTPLPRLPVVIPGAVQPPRAQVPQVLATGQSQFMQIPPPPYPGPPPPYPGQQEQPLLLEDLLEEEKRELEKQAATPTPNSGPALMSDADFEMLRADVLGTNAQVSSPPNNTQGVPLFNLPILSAPPLPPETIVTEQDKQAQVQYEQWLHNNNAAVSQQLKYYETEVQKLRKLRKSLNSKQRQLRKNGNELSQRDALELQRVTGEQTVLQKHLEAARKQSRQHSMVMQEYQSKQEQKPNGGGIVGANNVNITGNGSPHSPALTSPGVTPQPPQPSPHVSPLHHSPRIGTPQSQGGDDKSDVNGLPSPRPPPMVPTPPSPQQFTQIRHPGMVPRFARSPEGGIRPRMLVTQVPANSVAYNSPRVFTSSPQPISSTSILSSQNTTNQTIRLQAPQSVSAQHQQLLLHRQQLQQQKQQLLQHHQELNQEVASKQLQEGMQRPILQQRQLSTEETLTRQQQLHMLQRQQQLAQQNRQLLSQQGKVGQFRQILQQSQQNFSQNTPIQSPSPLGHLQAGSPIAQSPMVTQSQSPVPQSPIGNVQQFNPSSSPLHPQSPMLTQFQASSSPMPQHSPRVQNYQTSNSSPMTPQSPMVYSGLQTPNSPMPQFNQPISPMPPQSPRVQQYNQQPPSPMTPQSPMIQQQFVHRPNSPMPPRSPMPPMNSPMPMRRPSSTGGSVGSSPATERPQSVENPRTPQDQEGGGGGNPNNPMNPIPFPPGWFGRFGYFKLGLRGGSPMWSGKTPPRKPLNKGGKISDSSASSSSQQSDDHKISQKEISLIPKVASLVCVDYNDFDDESRTPPLTPPAKPALIKKGDAGTPKTRQSEDTDSELTVYDDIVLVESCKETNLEVEELQSALEGNVMSTVVSMPMVIDPGHIQMMDVESNLLDDCLVGSTDLVVLDVENGSNENECILEVVDKESDEILILEGNGIDDGLKVDESELIHNSEELMDLEEDTPSPPTGRKRMIGKVLPGESIMKEEKHVSDSQDSPEEDLTETSPETYLQPDHEPETVLPLKEEKIESYKGEQMNKISKIKYLQKQEEMQEDNRNIVTIQPNVVVSHPAVTFTPVVTQKSLPICTERRLSRQQATVASLVQNAVNAAKLAAEQRAAANNNSSGDITLTSNVITSSILTTPNSTSTSVNLYPQFLPIAVVTKNDKHIGVKEFKKEHELLRTSETIHSRIQNSLSEKLAAERKMLEEERNENIRKMFKSDNKYEELKQDKSNDVEKRDIKIYERDKKSEKQEESSYDIKYNKPPWESSHFNVTNYDKSKAEDLRAMNDKRLQFKTQMKVDQGDKKEMEDNKLSSDKGNISLPCVTMSSSILEAQLTSMLRTTEPSVAQKFMCTLINRSTVNEIKKSVAKDDDHDEMRVEGLAAQFHGSIKSEGLKLLSEIKKIDVDDSRNSKVQPMISMKHGNIYVNSQMKNDTVMVGGKSYKIFQAGPQASTSDILNICENISTNKTIETSNVIKAEEPKHSGNESQQRVEILKNYQFSDKVHDSQRFSQSNERRNSLNENRLGGMDILQQRIVSSSESSHCDKETHHVSFNAAKALQKEEPKKFLPLSTMLMQKKDSEEKASRFPLPRTPEDSQNVLLKQLLQNTACATTTAAQSAPLLPIVPSLEAQLARPVPPTPSSLIPPVLNEPPKSQAQKESQQIKIQQQGQEAQCTRVSSQPSSLDELLSPPTTQLQPPPPPPPPPPPHPHPSPVKREPVVLSQPGPVMTPMVEVKKEPPPLTSPVVVEVKKEVVSSDEMLSPGLKNEPDHPGEAALQDLKKQKRRVYQQKRRQSLGKETIGGTPKKRPRKSSKVEEDYDSFIDSLMLQLRQTPAMTICEPNLTYNFTACPIFGSGDLGKVNSSTRFGELKGVYGNAYLPNENDYYNTLPFGDLPPRAPSTPSTQRGFYNEEFAPLKLHSTKDEFDEKKFDYNRDRDNDTPDTIISSSSPECIMPETPHRFPGLQLIDSDNEEDKMKSSRYSPEIPIIAPLALRAKPARLYSDMDKENEGPHGKRHCDVTVTLTLNSQASDDVLSVLRNLANVLRIPVPVNYSITERTLMQPSQKLGLYRFKGKDGKEGVPVDIQSILNGAAKFCRHCDMIILNNLMKKKASEMPLVAKQGEEDLYFCSSACYMQVALTHPSIQNEKAVPLVEHPKTILPSKKIKLETSEPEPIKQPDVKKESPDSDVSESSLYMGTRGAGKRDKLQGERIAAAAATATAPYSLKKSPSRYRVWTSNSIPPASARHKKPTEKEITEMLFRLGITVQPPKLPDDVRSCLFCHQIGDGVTDGPARLLNFDVNKWVHLNCALWSDEVYETVSGGLVNVELALQNGITMNCAYCNATGATLKCYKMRCSLVYHLPCAVKDQCVFYKNKTLYCSGHVPKNEKENELTTLSVMRRVYISRDENRQVASIMHHSEQTNLMRIGSLIFLSVGQLLPHQLQAFHTPNYIYPIGYKILRMYWSMRVVNKRCRYICSIHEVEGKPEFRILIQERGEPDLELKDKSAHGVWLKVLEPLTEKRKSESAVQLFTKFISGEDLFGLTEPAIVRVLESLPGVETLTDYRFKYGRNPLLELPLAINPSGCARSEGRPKGHWKRAHTQRTCSVSLRPSFTPSTPLGEAACPYSKQFVHSKSSQYKKMKQEWRNNVYLARSKIQGLGLYAARDLERHTMVIEYIGEIIRTELAETREKQYEAKNRGIYMFRLDEDRVVDATLSGGLARYINHSCSPNCVAETVEVDRDIRIIIFTKRRINRGEELAYDYKFDIEDDQHKIPCNCGAPNCRKWMN